MKYRYILLHYHIFKNAGTTISWILERVFGNAYRPVELEFDRGAIVTSELVRFVKQNRQVAALSGHHFCLPAPKHERYRFVELCLLRHPLDRLQSVWHYYRRLERSTDVSVAKAQALSLPDYLVWLRANQPYNVMDVQTCILGNRGRYFFPPAPRHLERAIETMRELSVLGIVERVDDCLIVAEHFLRPYFGDLDLSYQVQNRNPIRQASLAERLDEMRRQCGGELYSELEEMNRLDLQLLAAGEEEFERRLRSIPDLEQRRHDFRSRCATLREQLKAA